MIVGVYIMETRDSDIRVALHQKLNKKYEDDSDTIILDELVLCHGKARADVAVINGSMIGYEIKSDRDTLRRLPNQIEAYNKIFDSITIITGESHLEEVKSVIPNWWGINVATPATNGEININTYRESKKNDTVEAFELIKFLLRDELLYLIDEYGLEKKYKRIPKFKIWPYILDNFSFEFIKDYVRNCLQARKTPVVD